MQSQGEADQVQYIEYNNLTNPEPNSISYEVIEEGLKSKQWKKNFDTVTLLRQANRFYANLFLHELLPRSYQQIVQQIENLRSNNSKQSLKLVSEIFQHQCLDKVPVNIASALLNAVFFKSVSQKGFLKRQALKAIDFIPKKYNPCFVKELSQLTQSVNSQISELSVKTLTEYIQTNKISKFDPIFYQTFAKNLEGKRAVLQKKAKQIMQDLKKRIGQQVLIDEIEGLHKQNQLTAQQRNILIRQTKKDGNIKNTTQTNFRDFMKLKKKPESTV